MLQLTLEMETVINGQLKRGMLMFFPITQRDSWNFHYLNSQKTPYKTTLTFVEFPLFSKTTIFEI